MASAVRLSSLRPDRHRARLFMTLESRFRRFCTFRSRFTYDASEAAAGRPDLQVRNCIVPPPTSPEQPLRCPEVGQARIVLQGLNARRASRSQGISRISGILRSRPLVPCWMSSLRWSTRRRHTGNSCWDPAANGGYLVPECSDPISPVGWRHCSVLPFCRQSGQDPNPPRVPP